MLHGRSRMNYAYHGEAADGIFERVGSFMDPMEGEEH